MAEQAAFHLNRVLSLALGVVFLGLAGVFAAVLFPSGLTRLDGTTGTLLLAVAAMAGFGLWCLADLRKTGVIVMVDRNGITDLRLMADPIPWDEVERCTLVRGPRTRYLWLVLRPGSQAAQKLGRQKVPVNDLVLTGGGRDLRGAIARLAPQVMRDW